MTPTRSLSAIGISIFVHASVLTAMAMIQQNLMGRQPEIVMHTVFDDERLLEEFQKELEVDQTISETLNTLESNPSFAANLGKNGPDSKAINQKLTDSRSRLLEDPKINFSPTDFSTIGDVGTDISGQGDIKGLSNEVVSNYAAALGRMTQELIRLMRKQKVLVVWLFDESGSMKDDQQQIKQKFHKIYVELGVHSENIADNSGESDVLLTAIHGFGDEVHALTQKPTASIPEIHTAIDRIAVDESGNENMCLAVNHAIDRYAAISKKQQRRLVLVIVSDESPTDAANLEESITKSKRNKVPVYVMGHEAIFGYPYARTRWIDPIHGLSHWVQIHRGPETAFPELLQYNGLTRRYDSDSSGFGPYSQVRLAKETGGVFFVLPGEEANLVGRAAHDKRKFDSYAMKEYEPQLLSARDYVTKRDRSEFRKAIWNVIDSLNPYRDRELELATWHYPIHPVEFQKFAAKQFPKALRAMHVLNQAVKVLEDVGDLREQEQLQRWRANYDLIYAQCLAYRVRLFQFLLALDQHAKTQPQTTSPKNNEWRIQRVATMLEPDPQQIKQTKVDIEQLKKQESHARELYQRVIDEHPETPWAQRAKKDLVVGFGIKFADYFWDPKYRDQQITIPRQ